MYASGAGSDRLHRFSPSNQSRAFAQRVRAMRLAQGIAIARKPRPAATDATYSRFVRPFWRQPSREGAIEPQDLKFMWDYSAFPVWSTRGAMVRAERLPVSDQLRSDLQGWSDRMTDLMWGPRGPDDPRWGGP